MELMADDASPGELLFEVLTPLGFRVRVTRAYWSLIVTRYQRRRVDMAQVKVFYDEVGNTLTVWFGNPEDEHVAEETGDEVVLMKDKTGRVIGFEKLNFSIVKPKHLQVAFETIAG